MIALRTKKTHYIGKVTIYPTTATTQSV